MSVSEVAVTGQREEQLQNLLVQLWKLGTEIVNKSVPIAAIICLVG